LLIDVDWFKKYNDRYGHAAGDARLHEIATAISDTLWRPIDVCARYGGEEFVVVLHDTDLDGARVVAERINEAIHGLYREHAESIHGVLTVSIGAAAVVPDHNASFGGLFEAADRALYRAKRNGRNRVEISVAAADGKPALSIAAGE
jgi:two-component system chemotaxis family response regulator WspR